MFVRNLISSLLILAGFAWPAPCEAGLGTPSPLPARPAHPAPRPATPTRADSATQFVVQPSGLRTGRTITEDPAAVAIPRWRKVLANTAKWLSIAGCLFTAVGWLAIPQMLFGVVLVCLISGIVVGFLSVCAGIAALWKGRALLDKPTRRRAIGGIIRGSIVLLLTVGGIVLAGLAFIYY